LMLSEDILKLLPPKAYGYNRSRESFKARTGVAFDMLGATETAASMSLGLLLNAQRANRMVELKARYDHLPGLIEMLRNLSDATWFEKSLTGVEGEVQRTIRMLVLQHMMRLGASPYAMPQVKAIVNSELIRVKGVIDSRVVLSRDDARRVHAKYASSLIDQYLQTLTLPKPPSPLGTPDGSPIGMSCQFD